MAVLLTGGLGYIGSHTAAELVKSGETPVIIDNYTNCAPEAADALARVIGFMPKVYRGDVRDGALLKKVFTENEISAVIHFAGYKSVGESVHAPLKYYENNLDSTLVLLKEMQTAGCRRLVFSSSATVYGCSNPVPFREDMPAGGCTNPYGWTKYMIERILTDAAAADEAMSVVLLRYFNPIGAHESGFLCEKPRGVPENLMPYIVQTAAGQREKLMVFGDDYPTSDGTGVRDYIHVCDLAAGHICALTYAKMHTGTEIFNLGTGHGVSVLELLKTFERVNHVCVPYEITARRPGDIAWAFADAKKAEAMLGFKTRRTVEDMCRDSWAPVLKEREKSGL